MEKELISLIRFLSKGLTDLEADVFRAMTLENAEDCRDYLIMKTPRLQGSKTIQEFIKIGRGEFKQEDLTTAVNYILDKDNNGNTE